MTILKSLQGAAAAVALTFSFLASAANAQPLQKLPIVIFGWPSLGAILPPIIKAHKLDAKLGMDIEFVERTPDAYTAQFNSGEFKVGGSAALLTVGLADLRGVKVAYLFNIFDFYGTIVTSNPDVKSLRDLEGKTLAAARATTNFVMANWFATRLGVDMKKVSVVNTAPAGLVGYALANRADGIQVWEPALTTLRAKNPAIRVLDLDIAAQWTKFSGSANVPYLGLAAHMDWIAQNPGVVGKLWQMHKEAADWLQANPDAAAKIILPKGDAGSLAGLVALIRANERLGLNMKWAGDIRKEIEQVYGAGRSIDYLPGAPSAGSIYSGK
jgi:NitT/TauT family transport system substrate-binding protein